MPNRVSFFVGLIVKADTPLSAASSASGLVDAFNANPSSFALVNQYSQTAATIASVVSVAIEASPVAFLNVATNTFAGATVFLKIVADVNSGKSINVGDVYGLVSNVAAVAVTLTVMATGGAALTVVTVGILASAGSFISSDVVQNIFKQLIDPLWLKYYKDQPSATYKDRIVAAQLTYATQQEYINNHQGKRLVCTWNFQSGHGICEETRVGSGSGGDFWGWENSGSGEIIPISLPGGHVIVEPNTPDDEYQNDEYNKS